MQSGGFSAAGGADQDDEFAIGDVKVDGIDGFDAAGKDFADVIQFDYSHSSFRQVLPECGDYTDWLKMVNFGEIGVGGQFEFICPLFADFFGLPNPRRHRTPFHQCPLTLA